jgi:hypothetical protein
MGGMGGMMGGGMMGGPMMGGGMMSNPMMGGSMMGGDPYGGGMMGGDPYGGGMMGGDPYGGGMMGGDHFGGKDHFGGGDDFFGGGDDFFGGGDDFFGGGDDFGPMDFFYSDPYADSFYDPYYDPYLHDTPDVYISEGAAVAYSDPGVNTMVLADGGNTVTINSSQIITNGTLIGGNGADLVTMTGVGAIGTVNLGAGNDSITLAGNNILNISNTETVTSSIGSDILTFTGSGATTILASQGNDTFNLSSTAGSSYTIRYAATNQIGDTINTFVSAADDLVFSRAAFQGDGDSNGALDSNLLDVADGQTSASTLNAYWVRDSLSNNLYYDADHSGSGNGVLVANLDAAVVAADITFV